MEEGLDQEEMRQYVLDLTSQCEKDGKACYDLGKLYLMGVGDENVFKVDIEKAKMFLEFGCIKQYGKSCCLLSGILREQDKHTESKGFWLEAQRLLTRDCEFNNEPNACMFWGLELLASSDDPVVDYPVALRFLERGCKLGQPVCCVNAGVIVLKYLNDGEKAIKYFEKGCELENGDACWLYGEQIERNESSNTEYTENPTDLYKKACDLNCLEGCVAHGANMIRNGKFDMGLESLTKACDRGDANGCELGGMILTSLDKITHASQMFERGCTLGSDDCCQHLKNQSTKE